MMYSDPSLTPGSARILVYAETLGEAEALAESLAANYGCITAAVASAPTARLVLMEGRFDVLVSHSRRDDLAWVPEVAPGIAVVALGGGVPPRLPRVLLVPQWPQPVEGLMAHIQQFLHEGPVAPGDSVSSLPGSSSSR